MSAPLSGLLAATLLATAPTLPPQPLAPQLAPASERVSPRASARRMHHLLVPPPAYIRPPAANLIDAPLPAASDQVVGIYGNILYPADQELLQKEKLYAWLEACSRNPDTPFPLSPEEFNDISLYILERLPLSQIISAHFAARVQNGLAEGKPLETALEEAKLETLAWSREIAQKVPALSGRYELFAKRLLDCANQAERTLENAAKQIRENPESALLALLETRSITIETPFDWDTRTAVFRQMVDKVISVSPNSPYFLALQEVTPQALGDLKRTLADRDLQWISFNNLSGKETLEPRQEEVFGEATGFTTTLALSRDLEVLKVELGDLPTESGSVRKILGVRVRNSRTGDVFTIFTTHTDHAVKNDIYARTAAKVHEFATRFFEDAPDQQRYVFGGDLNAFDQLGGGAYVNRLRELFAGSKDFRETDYYAPCPIADSTFIGRPEDGFKARISPEGILEPNGLDQVFVGSGIDLQSAGREAAVYDESGRLLDYYTDREKYLANLQKRIAFSDHFFNIVRFR